VDEDVGHLKSRELTGETTIIAAPRPNRPGMTRVISTGHGRVQGPTLSPSPGIPTRMPSPIHSNGIEMHQVQITRNPAYSTHMGAIHTGNRLSEDQEDVEESWGMYNTAVRICIYNEV
jgi:hypothetical protein